MGRPLCWFSGFLVLLEGGLFTRCIIGVYYRCVYCGKQCRFLFGFVGLYVIIAVSYINFCMLLCHGNPFPCKTWHPSSLIAKHSNTTEP